MNSRVERLIREEYARGLKKVKAYVGIALTLILLIAVASYKNCKPWLARIIEYYAQTIKSFYNRSYVNSSQTT